MYSKRSNGISGDTAVLAFTLGLAAGVVGTVLFAALDERKFRRVVKRARRAGLHAEELTRELADKTASAVDELTRSGREQLQTVTTEARRRVRKAHDSLEDVIDSVEG